MKRFLLAAIFLVLGTGAHAQTQQEAIRKTMNERYEDAASDFHRLIAANAASGEVYFYAGDNYFYWGELDSAEVMFRKGSEVAPANPLNFVGLGRVARMRNNTAGGQSHFSRALELMNAKGAMIEKAAKELAFIKMAESCLQKPDQRLDEARQHLDAAFALSTSKRGEVTVSNPELYLQMGDYYSEKDGFNLTNALAQYSKAFDLNPQYTRTLLRQGQLFVKVRNWDEGLKYFNQAIEADPTFAPAYREKAELLYRAGRYQQAIESYQKYLGLNNSCRVQQRYASFIYLTKEYKKATEEIEKAIPCNPENLVMYRVLGYAYYELGDYAKGLENIEKYFRLAEAKDRNIIVGTDLAYKGKLLSKMGNDSLGIELIRQAMQMDTSYKDGFGEIAQIYSKAKKYAQAAEWFEKKIAASSEKAPLDFYYLGQSCYFSKDYTRADKAFEQATEKYPDAWFWRAKCNSKLDNPDAPAGLARPFYETAIRKVGQDPRNIEANRKNLVEAYSYLGLLHGKQDNFECSKAAWLKVIELDPANKIAGDAMKDAGLQNIAGNCDLVPAQ